MILILERVVSGAIFVYQLLIFIRVMLTWVQTDPHRSTIDHPLVLLLRRVTDPVLDPLRRLIPPIGGKVLDFLSWLIPPIDGKIDVSPIVALVLLEILRRILSSVLLGLAS